MEFIYIIIAFLVAFGFRTSYGLYSKNTLKTFDTYYHIYLINFIRDNTTKELIEYVRFLRPSGINYPWLIHYLLSKIPKKFDNIVEKYINAILDSLFCTFLIVFSFFQTNSIITSMFVGLIYLFLPVTFSILSTGPRISTFTPRVIGEISGNLIFILEYLYLVNNDYSYYVMASFLAIFVFMTSKFSVQSLFIINLFLSIYTLHFELIGLFFIGMIGAIVVSKGRYIAIITQQYKHLRWYFLLNINNNISSSSRNSIIRLIKYIKELNIKKLLYYLNYENTFSILIIKYPVVIIVIYLLFDNYILVNDYFTLFILSFFSVFIIISFKFFAFIGEAERYMNYGFYFLILPVAEYCTKNYFILFALIIIGLIFYILDLKDINIKNNYKFNREDNLINWLNSQDNILNVATVPFSLGGRRIIVETQHNWFYNLPWIDQKEKQVADSFMYKYPFLNLFKLDKFKKKYNIDYVFINENYMLNNGVKKEHLESITKFKISGGIIVC